MDVALIGFGAIGKSLFLYATENRAWRISAIISSVRSEANVRQQVEPGIEVVTAVDQLTSCPDMIVECAGHDAVQIHGLMALDRGWPLMVVSVGALTDDSLLDELKATALKSGARLILPAGAMAGIDGLAAARQAGLERVSLKSRKPPAAWKETPAEELLDLDCIEEPTAFYQGSAREAARSYPKNANTAATVSLAGIGFDATEVTLVADPDLSVNRHEVFAEGAFGTLELAIENRPLPDNPKTSMITVLSILRRLDNECSVLCI